jgi:hypothetical protein
MDAVVGGIFAQLAEAFSPPPIVTLLPVPGFLVSVKAWGGALYDHFGPLAGQLFKNVSIIEIGTD